MTEKSAAEQMREHVRRTNEHHRSENKAQDRVDALVDQLSTQIDAQIEEIHPISPDHVRGDSFKRGKR